MNKLYKEFYKQRLFSLDEANKVIKNYQVCKNNIQRLLFKEEIRTIKPGIYYIVPLDDEEFYPDRIHIASKLRTNSIISCNSALFVFKLAQEENNIYVFSKYNSKLRIKDRTYKILKNKYSFGVIDYEYVVPYASINLRITDIERTILDCLRTKNMKFEDLLNILKTSKPRLDFSKIFNYLEKFKIPVLYNKTGFLLEQAGTNLIITDAELDKIKKKLTKKIYYLREKELKLVKPKYKYNKTWNLMVPENLVKK